MVTKLTPEPGGLHHLRQRWAQENFGTDSAAAAAAVVKSKLPKPNEPIDSGSTYTNLNEVTAPQPYQNYNSDLKQNNKNSNNSHSIKNNTKTLFNTTSLTLKRMPSWKDLVSKHSSFVWSRSESRLAEVHAKPPEGSSSRKPEDEEEASGSRSRSPIAHEKPSDVAPSNNSSDTVPPWLIEVYTVSWLIFFSILGTLARLGVEAITQYPGAPVTSRVLWANIGGSFTMGFLIEDRRLFKRPVVSSSTFSSASASASSREESYHQAVPPTTPTRSPDEIKAEHLKFKKTIPLYIGLSTGFCGSFTSFSSFVRDAFLALTNDLETPSTTEPFHPSTIPIHSRNGGFSFLALLAILIIHPALSLAAFKVGAQFALLISPITPVIPANMLQKFLNPLMVFVSLGCWLGVSLGLSVSPPTDVGAVVVAWRARAMLPMVFGPLGCLARYYLSKYMNGIRPDFPLGTFTSNILATAVLGMAWDLQHARSIRSAEACAVLTGVVEGFCGCLSTVSTWVVELDGLGPRKGWIYGFVSTAVGLGFLICIMGGMGWTVGFAPTTCG